MNEFSERYKKLSNSELLKILKESDKYKPIAVETAKVEIENRQLSEAEISQAENEISNRENTKRERSKKLENSKLRFKKEVSLLLETINPIQKGTRTPEKIIRTTILVFACLAIFALFQEFGLLRYMITDSRAVWDFSMFEYFFPIILLPTSVVLFWRREKVGWIFLSIFLAYSTCNAIVFFLLNFTRQSPEILGLESVFPTTPLVFYIVNFLFYGGFLIMISKKGVRGIFRISKLTMIITIGLTIIFDLICIYLIFR